MESKDKSMGELRIGKFEVGDLVFTKLKGYPPWPSKINQIETTVMSGKEVVRYNIFFYGTHQTSIVRSSYLYPYEMYAKSIVEKWGRKPKFHDALIELEREMMDKIAYLNQLRTTTPDPQLFHGFMTASNSNSLSHDIGGVHGKAKSKHHLNQKRNANAQDDEEEVDESRKLGYEVLYIQRIPFPDTPESMIVLSLRYNEEWVKEESEKLKDEERMMNCFVKIEPFPPEYAHLDPKQERYQKIGNSTHAESAKVTNLQDDMKDASDESDVEALETCPVCRLCFFSQADLRDHERSQHGSVSTAESLFERLMTSEPVRKKEDPPVSWKEGYPLDTML